VSRTHEPRVSESHRHAAAMAEQERYEAKLLADLRHEVRSLRYDVQLRDARRGAEFLNGLTPDSPWWGGVEGGF
jgi:hypothetical protein